MACPVTLWPAREVLALIAGVPTAVDPDISPSATMVLGESVTAMVFPGLAARASNGSRDVLTARASSAPTINDDGDGN